MKNLLTLILVAMSSPAWAADYVLEADHTYAYFKVMHMNQGDLTGVFKDVRGTMKIDGDTVEAVNVQIAVASVDTFERAAM